VHEEHLNTNDPFQANYIAFDRARGELLIISRLEAMLIDLERGFASRKVGFDDVFAAENCGVCAYAGRLFYALHEEGIFAIDTGSGEVTACLPTHRTISNILPAVRDIVVVENNEIIYEAGIEDLKGSVEHILKEEIR
jgi:hypothetical protein